MIVHWDDAHCELLSARSHDAYLARPQPWWGLAARPPPSVTGHVPVTDWQLFIPSAALIPKLFVNKFWQRPSRAARASQGRQLGKHATVASSSLRERAAPEANYHAPLLFPLGCCNNRSALSLFKLLVVVVGYVNSKAKHQDKSDFCRVEKISNIYQAL